jgi:hypothetical protein
MKLKKLYNKFDRLLPAHNGTPISKSYIDDFIILSDKILKNEIKPCNTVVGYGIPFMMWGGDRKLKRYRYGNASFICTK